VLAQPLAWGPQILRCGSRSRNADRWFGKPCASPEARQLTLDATMRHTRAFAPLSSELFIFSTGMVRGLRCDWRPAHDKVVSAIGCSIMSTL